MGSFRLLCCGTGEGGGGKTAQLTPREGKGTPELTLSACYNFTQLAHETALCSSLVKRLTGTL